MKFVNLEIFPIWGGDCSHQDPCRPLFFKMKDRLYFIYFLSEGEFIVIVNKIHYCFRIDFEKRVIATNNKSAVIPKDVVFGDFINQFVTDTLSAAINSNDISYEVDDIKKLLSNYKTIVFSNDEKFLEKFEGVLWLPRSFLNIIFMSNREKLDQIIVDLSGLNDPFDTINEARELAYFHKETKLFFLNSNLSDDMIFWYLRNADFAYHFD